MRTDYESSFGDSMIKMVGFDMAKNAAKAVYEESGIGPEDVDVVELHDCFTTNEVLTYEALGLWGALLCLSPMLFARVGMKSYVEAREDLLDFAAALTTAAQRATAISTATMRSAVAKPVLIMRFSDQTYGSR